jgi:hypothetical protein
MAWISRFRGPPTPAPLSPCRGARPRPPTLQATPMGAGCAMEGGVCVCVCVSRCRCPPASPGLRFQVRGAVHPEAETRPETLMSESRRPPVECRRTGSRGKRKATRAADEKEKRYFPYDREALTRASLGGRPRTPPQPPPLSREGGTPRPASGAACRACVPPSALCVHARAPHP